MDRKIKVILVECHKLVREGLHEILASAADVEVVGAAEDGPEAVELATRLLPDVVVLDADLPRVEEVIRHLATGPLRARILVLSANGGVQRALNLLWAGATGYLYQSAGRQDLIAALRHVSRGEMALGPIITREIIARLTHRKPDVIAEGDELREALSERQMAVLRLLCQGYTDKQIAQKLYLSVRTVNGHLSHIYARLGVHSRTEAMHLALEKGWVSLSVAVPLVLNHLTLP